MCAERPHHRKKILLAEQRQTLRLVAQNDEPVAGLDVENFACLRRYHDLPLVADRDEPKGVIALGRHVQAGGGRAVVDKVVQRDAENLRQLLAAVDVGQAFAGIT